MHKCYQASSWLLAVSHCAMLRVRQTSQVFTRCMRLVYVLPVLPVSFDGFRLLLALCVQGAAYQRRLCCHMNRPLLPYE